MTPHKYLAGSVLLFLLLFHTHGGALSQEEAPLSLEQRIWDHMKIETYWPEIARSALEEWGEGAFPSLVEVLQKGDKEVSRKAAYYLGVLGDPRGAEPIHGYLERLASSESQRSFGYIALGWIGNEEALNLLGEYARDPKRAEYAVRGLTEAKNRKALDILTQRKKERGDTAPDYLAEACDSLSAELAKQEGLLKASSIPQPNVSSLDFWRHQTPGLDLDLEKEIVGDFKGSLFWSDYFENHEVEGVRVSFLPDGTFRSNLGSFAHLESLRKNDFVREYDLLPSDSFKGKYRVLSPTQLAMSPGRGRLEVGGAPVIGVVLRKGCLSFYHRNLKAFFSLSKDPEFTHPFTLETIAGTYDGTRIISLSGKDPFGLEREVEWVVSKEGRFTLTPEPDCEGEVLIDKFGR
ncbi:MAG: hypothetical protein KC944_15735, partial [Candidatus Omnitrophica bacterium]|nr:hypothetical protein [Candidatus Omnitrophota bacterium]